MVMIENLNKCEVRFQHLYILKFKDYKEKRYDNRKDDST
nr:MAG TPA: hypothetical protein [Caudoviricetes sp.]